MVKAFHVFTLLLVSIAMALSLAHALELPGKMRLARETYIEVQSIYYPGFSLGGMVGDFGGLVALLVLTWLLRHAGAAFWLVLAALALLAAMNLVYWLLVHPVNSVWMQGTDLGGLAGSFFAAPAGSDARSWIQLRDIWEYSHLARACLAMGSFLATAIALTV